MKAISLWRPWPWTFFHAGKRIENRSRKPPTILLGEWVAMHAAIKFDNAALRNMRAGEFGGLARNVPATGHPTGIVGAFRITGAFEFIEENPRDHGIGQMPADDDWPPEPAKIGKVTPADISSEYAFGPWCWTTPDVVELPEPIPCKGRQGLWNLEPEMAATILAEING